MKALIILLFSIFSSSVFAQKKSAFVLGKVVDENQNPLPKVSVMILGKTTGIITNDSGYFKIKTPADKAFALVFTHLGYNDVQKSFYLNNNEEETAIIKMEINSQTLQTITITDDTQRKEIGLTKLNSKDALTLPSTIGGVEGLIKTLVGSNNELTSQYNVRGGNYDENIIYVNDFEIFRPYLVNNAQQEGLSFINPELSKNINFYNGGFQSKYGDKMSSVLDIQYKKPTSFAGTAYVSLLEQGVHFEGVNKKGNVTYLFGARNKTNKNLLSSQETVGAYIPSSSDIQGYITYKINNTWQLEFLGNYSTTAFTFFPQSAQKTTAVFSPLFTEDLGLDIIFDGKEQDNYKTNLIGLSALYNPTKKLKLKWMLSKFGDIENQNFDIAANYLFGERDFDRNSATFGQITNPLGTGYYQNYGRDALNIGVYNATLKGSIENKKHFIQFGNSIEQTTIHDKIYEWEYQDSTNYSLPYNPTSLRLSSFINSSANLSIQKYSGFVQDNIKLGNKQKDITLQAGIRYNYNSLNKKFLISPRLQISFKPQWKKDIVFKFSSGIYSQPPFYRELRTFTNLLNTNVKAQKSYQLVAGMDYNFKGFGDRSFKLTTDAYYKRMWDVDIYDINNVKINYAGNNNAIAYATGLEAKLFGELVKDAESWLSIGLMQTKEKIDNDYYYNYKNAAGQIITASSTDKVVVDSIRQSVGWLRRPSDRLITVGVYLEDYLPTNKNFKVHLNTLYGSNTPFNIPGSVKYRNALIIDPYIRIDIGFSAQLLSEKNSRRSHSPFKNFQNIWASFEVFNLIDRQNVISYQLIKDFANNVYSIPTSLTPRLINLKIVGRF